MPKMLIASLALLGLAHAAGAALAADVRGVTSKEIVIGTSSDLSGVTVEWGVNSTNAIRMAFDERNAKGGVNGRSIRYIVEDTGYSVPRHVQAVNKLINRDNAFILLANGGVSLNNATLPTLIEKQVPNVFPLAMARSMATPFNKYKFALISSYYDQVRAGVSYFVERRGKKSICVQTHDTDFGREVMDGARDQLQAMGGKAVLAASALNKPTDTDFTASVAKLRASNCDLVVLGGITRDTLQFVAAVRKAGWNVDMVGQSAIYDFAVAEAAGGTTEGIYAFSPALVIEPDDARPEVRQFVADYKARFGRTPNFAAQLGYSFAHITLAAIERAGKDLTVDGFIAGLEGIKDYQDLGGIPPISFSASEHHGSRQSFMSQVQKGRWVALLDKKPWGY